MRQAGVDPRQSTYTASSIKHYLVPNGVYPLGHELEGKPNLVQFVTETLGLGKNCDRDRYQHAKAQMKAMRA
jgi:hypothetical protein